MIERDEAALQALQKMYHDEDYAMDLVKQAADRLGDFQPAVAEFHDAHIPHDGRCAE